MKTCLRCGQTKGNRNYATFGGGQLAAICKQCSNEAMDRLGRTSTPSEPPANLPTTTDKASPAQD